jgi:hypothetical protein
LKYGQQQAFDLTGKTALITGGSRGLGLQIAEALGERGARIVLSSRKAPDLEQAQQHLAARGIKAEWVAADNSKDDDVKRLADEALSKLGKVDILRRCRRHTDDRLQHEQGGAGKFYARACRKLGPLWHYGQRAGTRIFSLEDDQGNHRHGRGRETG